MITLITAVPGSGKTLYAVSVIQSFLNEGRPVYHNINGLVVDSFDNNHLLFPAPDDWTETPDGSVVIYDECQQEHLYPATGERGKVHDKRLTRLETHRHTGHDLFFITQAPTFVHHHVRKLVGQHIHFYRGSGMKHVAKYIWSHTCEAPNDRREQERADFSIFSFDKSLFSKYKSSTVHTHKFKVPKKLVFILSLIALLIFLIIYALSKSSILSGAFIGPSPDPGQPAKPAPVAAAGVFSPPPSPSPLPDSPMAWLADVPVIRSISGCISSASACRCYDSDLKPLDLADSQCRAVASKPLPRTLSLSSKNPTNGHPQPAQIAD